MEVTKLRDQSMGRDDEFVFERAEKFGRDELMVEIFTTEKLLEDLSIYWKELEKRADSKIYMSYEWAYNWWVHYGNNKQRSLFIITIWDGTKLVGLAPFYKGYSQFGSVTLERRLQLIGSGGSPNEQLGYLDDHGISNSLDLLVDKSYRDSVADLLAEEIMTYRFLGIDVLKFFRAGDDSFIMNYLYPRLQGRFPKMSLRHTDTQMYIDLNQDQLLREIEKEQETHADVTFPQIYEGEEYVIENISSDWEKVDNAVDKVVEFYRNRKDQSFFSQVFYDHRFKKFLKDTFRSAFKNGRLWVKQAKNKDGEICALRMALFYNGRYFDSVCSFEDSSRYGACNVLLDELVKDGVRKGAEAIELQGVEDEQKYDFTSEKFKTWKLTIPLGERDSNIPLLLNRVGAFFYKYFNRKNRPAAAIANQQEGLLKTIAGNIRLRWSNASLKVSHLE